MNKNISKIEIFEYDSFFTAKIYYGNKKIANLQIPFDKDVRWPRISEIQYEVSSLLLNIEGGGKTATFTPYSDSKCVNLVWVWNGEFH
jgi:hypothetical protein